MTRCALGFIGIGSIGQRMLRNAHGHERVRPVMVFDPDREKLQRALAGFPDVHAAGSAEEVIGHADVDVVYVASPPRTHAQHAHAALDAAKPVLCEKPLGVEEDVSRELVAHAERSGVPNAVNFVHSSGAGPLLGTAVRDGALGDVRCAELRIHGRQWAERRYAEAPWLRLSDQGGLVREVFSHYVFLSQRLFGPPRVAYCHRNASGPEGSAETQVQAQLVCGDVPVFMFGNTEGEGPDTAEYTVWGEQSSRRIVDLYQLHGNNGSEWRDVHPDPQDPAPRWFRAQLNNVADWAAGKPHTMPDFAEAFSVQQVIEEMLRH